MSRNLDSIVIKSGRIATPYLRLPVSVTSIDLSKTNQFISHTDLSEALSTVPGLFALDGQNYAQDLRISLRGFGARSAFGIRGIKLIVDGIPETTPDGQGQLDNISIGDITAIEVLQGTSGSQYGNASGGVINITTFSEEEYRIKLGLRAGSFGLQEYHLSTSQEVGRTLLQLAGTHQKSNGYREHSRLRQTNLLSKVTHAWNNHTLVWQSSFLDSPTAQDPGGINIEQATDMPTSARDRNLLFNAGEELKHWKSSLKLESKFNEHIDGSFSAFYSGRNFDGRLPFSFGGSIDLNRKYGGLIGQLNYKKISSSSINKLSFGYEILSQEDERDRFVNDDGIRSMMTLSQIEKFDNLGFYLIDQWSNADWTLNASIRYDRNNISVEDKFVGNGDDSGTRDLSSFNYSLGTSYKLSDAQSIFGSWSTSFETPVLSELSANPSGAGGFNSILNPTRARSLELGLKGSVDTKVQYTLTLFNISTDDELIPFELADFPGRDFYRNAGSTKRLGLEATILYPLTQYLSFNLSYAFSNFKYDEYLVDGTSLNDNVLPGIPKHSVYTALVYKRQKTFVKLSSQYFSRIFVRDDNTVSAEPYQFVNLRIGHDFSHGNDSWSLFIGVNNLFSATYFDNLRLNAFGSRHYEPAAKINLQIGVNLKFK